LLGAAFHQTVAPCLQARRGSLAPIDDHYRSFLLSKLLELSIVREVRSNVAIQTLKAGAVLPLDHLRAPAA